MTTNKKKMPPNTPAAITPTLEPESSVAAPVFAVTKTIQQHI